jgi:hypothetical protein
MDQELKDQFERIDQRFNKMDKRFEVIIQNMVTKAELEEMRSELADKKDIDRVLTAVDAIAKRSKDYDENVTVALSKLERIEHWIEDAAKKIGIEDKT